MSKVRFRQSWTRALGCAVALAFSLSAAARAQDFDTRTHTAQSPTDASRAKANAALEAHDYPAALKLLSALAVESPHDARLLYNLASTEDALDQTGPAEASYRSAIAIDATMLEPHLALGLLLARNARMNEARAELLLASGKEGAPALKARALRALARIDQKTRPADARDELIAALKLSPETPADALLGAELAAATPGSASDAQAAYRRVLADRQNDPEAAAALAHLLAGSNREPEAESLLRKALEAHAGDMVLSAQLAVMLHGAGKDAEALPLLRELHASEPADANVTRLLAGLLAETRAYAEAEPLYAALHAANPHDGLAASDWGDTLIHLKRFVEAERVLSAAVAHPETFPAPAQLGEAAARLAFAASENHDPAGSLQALALRDTVLPTSPAMLFLAAIAHDRLHQIKQAQQAYRDFLRASNGVLPDEEFEARHRLLALEHMK